MGNYVEFRLKTKKIPKEDRVIKKFGCEKNGQMQQIIDSEVLRLMDPYVPFDTGALRDAGVIHTNIGSGKITYICDYARYQYYIPMNHHGQTTAHWFEKMKKDKKEQILRLVKKAAQGK